MRIHSNLTPGEVTRMLFKRAAALAAMFTLSIGLNAASKPTRLRSATPSATKPSGPLEEYHLRMHHLHTGEDIDVVYRVGNTYISAALDQLNHFLRDHRTQDVSNYDPKEFDVLHAMMARLGKLNGVIEIVCGYRTPETNQALRQNSPQTGVAEHSQHMEGHAIDLRVPGVPTARLRDAALSLQAGGV